MKTHTRSLLTGIIPKLGTVLLAVLFIVFGGVQAQDRNSQDNNSSLLPSSLRCESQESPVAVEPDHPRLSWIPEASDAAARGLRQTAYRILVASSPELLAQDRGDEWDSGKVSSSQSIQISYEGQPLASGTPYYWKVRLWDQDDRASAWSSVSGWTMALRPDDWKAKWIAAGPDAPISRADGAPPDSDAQRKTNLVSPKPLPIFRHSFTLKKPIARATVYVTGLGQYELKLNGRKVGDEVLTPGWTDYRKTILYNTYDITNLVKSGENAIAIMLGNGMYNVQHYEGRYTKFVGSFGRPKLIAQLQLRFTDGTQTVLGSDSSWKWMPGPIVFSSTYGGEDFDARQEPAGWDEPRFDDADWKPAVEVSGPGGVLTPQQIPAIRVMHIYQPVKPTEPQPGVFVYDLGQNFSGWPQITVSGAAGATVRLIPGELLDSSGLVTQRSSGGPAYFSYTLKGTGDESWHPRFSYYGFRYVQVEGASSDADASGKPVVHELEGQFVHSSAPAVGTFSTSDELFNRIHGLIDAAIRSNMQSVLTDCPHREKLGWLEESHLLGAAIMYNFDVSRLYQKIAHDMSDSQVTDGLVPDIAPEYVTFERGFRDSPEWGSAAVLDPWIAYQFYGDRQTLAAHYGVMRRYVDYLSSRAQGGIISYGLGDWYDIGPGRPGESKLTSRGVTATAIYCLDLTVLSKTAKLLKRENDAQRYAELAASVRKAFNAKLFHSDTSEYDTGSQTANAMPLAVGLVPEDRRAAVLANLVRDIRKHNNHVTAGDVGFHFVVQALTEGGRSDVLYDMLSRTDSPSYGYQLAQGATTLTEAWDTDPRSSQDHFMLGHAEEWFYRGLAGIDFDLSRPAGEQIEIHPAVVGNIQSVEATYRSVLGPIASSWQRRNGALEMGVSIPANATARVFFPAKNAGEIREGNTSLKEARGVSQVKEAGSQVSCEIGSGTYRFEVRQ